MVKIKIKNFHLKETQVLVFAVFNAFKACANYFFKKFLYFTK